jgi:NTP pyrophosphatase (non-canonical NTP hydrolase)
VRVVVTFDEYQKAAARTMNPRLTDQEKLLDAAAGIAEEAGEVLAHVRKHLYQGKPLDRDKLAEELGDVLWCVAAVATVNGTSLDEVVGLNVGKLLGRYPDASPLEASPSFANHHE